jgi:hypothetical protein
MVKTLSREVMVTATTSGVRRWLAQLVVTLISTSSLILFVLFLLLVALSNSPSLLTALAALMV